MQYRVQAKTCFLSTQLYWLFLSVKTLHEKLLSLNTQGCACTLRALHHVACVGKRALGYCIAKRMAALNSLELKDSAGMVQYTDICVRCLKLNLSLTNAQRNLRSHF